MPIKIDCYLPKLKEYKGKFPKAHFEYVNNYNLLAPSKELKIAFGIHKKENGDKNPLGDFEEYSELYLKELLNDSDKISRMRILKVLAKKTDVYLICYCKDQNICHRKILRQAILDLEVEEDLEAKIIKDYSETIKQSIKKINDSLKKKSIVKKELIIILKTIEELKILREDLEIKFNILKESLEIIILKLKTNTGPEFYGFDILSLALINILKELED